MKITFALAFLVAVLSASAGRAPEGPWMAYNTEGRSAGLLTYPAGELVAAEIPVIKHNHVIGLSFLTSNTVGPLGDQFGRLLIAEMWLSSTGSPVWKNYIINGQTSPVSLRLWFSSQSAPYAASKVTTATQADYWWSNPMHAPLDVLLRMGRLEFADQLTPDRWSSAWGKSGADPAYTAAFEAAARNIRQVGLSFGAYFFDTGAKVETGTGTATLHIYDIKTQ